MLSYSIRAATSIFLVASLAGCRLGDLVAHDFLQNSLDGVWEGTVEATPFHTLAGAEVGAWSVRVEAGPDLKMTETWVMGRGVCAVLTARERAQSLPRVVRVAPELVGTRVIVRGRRLNTLVYGLQSDTALVPAEYRGMDVAYRAHMIVVESIEPKD